MSIIYLQFSKLRNHALCDFCGKACASGALQHKLLYGKIKTRDRESSDDRTLVQFGCCSEYGATQDGRRRA